MPAVARSVRLTSSAQGGAAPAATQGNALPLEIGARMIMILACHSKRSLEHTADAPLESRWDGSAWPRALVCQALRAESRPLLRRRARAGWDGRSTYLTVTSRNVFQVRGRHCPHWGHFPAARAPLFGPPSGVGAEQRGRTNAWGCRSRRGFQWQVSSHPVVTRAPRPAAGHVAGPNGERLCVVPLPLRLHQPAARQPRRRAAAVARPAAPGPPALPCASQRPQSHLQIVATCSLGPDSLGIVGNRVHSIV
jgi:hypothetical protein